MKKRILNIFTIVAIGFALVACKDKANEAKTGNAEDAATANTTSVKYLANKDASTIAWKGFKPTGTHTGVINIDNGVLTVNNGKIESGTFLVNMKSIVVTDIPADDEDNGKLAGHLKSPDFFDVEKFPTAAFEVTGFEVKDGKNHLSGNLTLKAKKNNVTIPVTFNETGDMLEITSEPFTIYRTKWDVRYGSKTIFDNLGDKFINDDMELKISIKAKKS